MTGCERLLEQVKGQKDVALKQTVDFLITRKDLEKHYLKEEKNISDMAKYIRGLGNKYMTNGWNYINNEVVYSWAVMYFTLPNKLLKIKTSKVQTKSKSKSESKNNVVSIEDAKKNEKPKQISLFGGADDGKDEH